jgi:hypothetical protein
MIVEATGPYGATVTWPSPTAEDDRDGPVPVTCAPPSGSVFPLGPTAVACSATDSAGNGASATFDVEVVDTTPPVISYVSADPPALWPPNHEMVSVRIDVAATDAVTSQPTCQITEVSSNEPVEGLGDGDAAPDWVAADSLTVDLRAERAGGGIGRTYSIFVECHDAAGNGAVSSTAVLVPHSMR